MGVSDLISLEQFVICNGTPISDKALQALFHQEQNRRTFSICYSTRIIVVRFVKPKGATTSKFHNIKFVRILVCCIILSLDYLIYFIVFEAL